MKYRENINVIIIVMNSVVLLQKSSQLTSCWSQPLWSNSVVGYLRISSWSHLRCKAVVENSQRCTCCTERKLCRLCQYIKRVKLQGALFYFISHLSQFSKDCIFQLFCYSKVNTVMYEMKSIKLYSQQFLNCVVESCKQCFAYIYLKKKSDS